MRSGEGELQKKFVSETMLVLLFAAILIGALRIPPTRAMPLLARVDTALTTSSDPEASKTYVKTDETTQNHAKTYAYSLLPLSARSSPSSFAIPTAIYDEQLGLTFTQSFSSLAYNVTALP
jgi:hypothetical protein